MTPLADLSSDWQVTFTSTKETETEPTLTDWIINPATLFYSGEAVYSRDFSLASTPKTPIFLEVEGGKPLPGSPSSPPEHPALGPNGLPDPRITRPGPGMHAYYDPPIHEAAIVFINGQRAGSLWHPPYRLEVTKLLKPGPNHIEIHVYNTALNAWSELPPTTTDHSSKNTATASRCRISTRSAPSPPASSAPSTSSLRTPWPPNDL